ncbi:hypothetical protein BgiMline_032167, partial [Biomphalaria glabrata]
IFIEFHEAIDKTNKLSLLLTTSEAGDNRLSSLPVLLDYTVSSLGSEELISLKL